MGIVRTYLGTAQRQSLEEEHTKLESNLIDPLITDKPAVRKQIKRVEHTLETQSPPVLLGPALDKEVRLEKELRGEIVPNMLSQEEMRKAPAGSVGRFMAFEKKYKEKILRWKNCQRTIHRGSDDPDIANLERYRPTVSQHNMHGALIQGKNFDFASPAFLEGYDGIDWSTRTREPGEEVETFKSRIRREKIAELRAMLATTEAEDEAEDSNGSKGLGRTPLSERVGLEKED